MKRFALVLALLLPFALQASRGSAAESLDTSFHSAALGAALHFEIYLPAGYDDGTQRYPVVYFLHGLPSGPTAYRSLGFVERGLERAGRPAIVVVPQGARAGATDPEYLGDWETAIAVELPRVVDARYRTIASRAGRAVVGVSAGGYGAMLLGLHHLGTFGAVESWSGYFHPTDPTGRHALDLGSPARNAHASAHTYVPALRARLARTPTLVAFYVGSSDDRFRDENEELDRELTAARVPHVFREYAGGHETALWEREAPAWLGLALKHLAPARPA